MWPRSSSGKGYVAALRAEGWDTVEVPPADDCPDAAFVEDTVVVYGDLAVIARPGADERRAETAYTEETLTALGYRIADRGARHAGRRRRPQARRQVWGGLGGRVRTSRGWSSSARCSRRSARVVGVPVSRVLHLKSAVTALPDGTVVGFEPLVDDPAVGGVPAGARGGRLARGPPRRGHGADVDQRPSTRALFEARGLRVVAVDIGEFEKLEGCVTCLSVRLRGLTRAAPPACGPVQPGRSSAVARLLRAAARPGRSRPGPGRSPPPPGRGTPGSSVAGSGLADQRRSSAASARRRSAGAAPGAAMAPRR